MELLGTCPRCLETRTELLTSTGGTKVSKLCDGCTMEVFGEISSDEDLDILNNDNLNTKIS